MSQMYTKRIGIRLIDSDYEKYKEAADMGGYEMSTFLRKLLRVGFKNYQRRQGGEFYVDDKTYERYY